MTQFNPLLISNSKDWLQYLDVVDLFFPRTIEEFEEKFKKGMEVIRKRQFDDRPYLFDFEFTKNFKKSVLNRTTHQEAIIIAVVKKLTFTSKESSASDLQDEYIQRVKEYRIRVTPRPASTRIHYSFNDDKVIFLSYYGEGEHDDGL